MKAIETYYKGYLFRSRLEARWAVFFDTLGLQWEYEPEGFDFGNGLRYLPDFRVQLKRWSVPVWFEVKASLDLIESFELNKTVRFSRENILAGGSPLFLLDGPPQSQLYFPIDCFLKHIEPMPYRRSIAHILPDLGYEKWLRNFFEKPLSISKPEKLFDGCIFTGDGSFVGIDYCIDIDVSRRRFHRNTVLQARVDQAIEASRYERFASVARS